MNSHPRNTLITAVVIIVIVVVISTAMTAIYSSVFYRNIPEFDVWTPLPSKTPTETSFIVEAVALSTNTVTPQDVSGNSSSLQSKQDCTYPQEYWVEHTELWPQQVIIGNEPYSASDIDQLLTDQTASIRDILVLQLYFAYLNNNSAHDTDIDATIGNANRWVRDHFAGDPLSQADRDLADEFIWVLSNFNLGVTGPGPCPPYHAITLTPSVTLSTSVSTTTQEASSTPTPTRYYVTYVPSATATKTDRPDRPTDVVRPPTDTPVPPKPTATSKPAPKPTEEPTSAPPENTPVPTQPPEPTSPPEPPTPTPAG